MIDIVKSEKIVSNFISFLFFALIAYSFFLPLKLSTFWFYVGFLVYLFGAVIETLAMLDFFTTPVDKLVTKGVYRISRNPMYLGMFLIFLGVSVACASLLFLFLTLALMILIRVSIVSEEHWCRKKYGDSYQKYVDEIPRWIGLPKSEKNDEYA